MVTNGDSEATSGGLNGIGQIEVVTPLPTVTQSSGVAVSGWTKTCLLNCFPSQDVPDSFSSFGYAFIANSNAGSTGFTGFPAGAWPNEMLKSYNFHPFPSGGEFLAIDGDCGQSKMTQSGINLQAGKAYKLSSKYAGAQQVNFSGDPAPK